MVNAVDLAKRALVKLLKEMAAIYTLTLSVARDSPDPAVRTAYRKVSVNAHPDRGGDADHQRQLNAAYSAWEAAAKAKQAHRGEGQEGEGRQGEGRERRSRRCISGPAAPLLWARGTWLSLPVCGGLIDLPEVRDNGRMGPLHLVCQGLCVCVCVRACVGGVRV